jgi:hypothetical protein
MNIFLILWYKATLDFKEILMKLTFLVFLVSFGAMASSNLCQQLYKVAGTKYIQLSELDELGDDFHVTQNGSPLFSESLMTSEEVLSVVGDFNASECENALREKEVYFKSLKKGLRFIYTNEDECDGGNSYGYVIDDKNKVVGHIGDSGIYCL